MAAVPPTRPAAQGVPSDVDMRVSMDAMTDMINKIAHSCFRKCVAKYSESDLAVGESSCIDRCVVKYFEVHNKVQGMLSGGAAATGHR